MNLSITISRLVSDSEDQHTLLHQERLIRGPAYIVGGLPVIYEGHRRCTYHSLVSPAKESIAWVRQEREGRSAWSTPFTTDVQLTNKLFSRRFLDRPLFLTD
uniref:Uncharacterized protein n=1 Tax=Cacopsylla melanoneura TaxID=428564 RepID=A0A8D8TUK7_9HEMI